MIELTEERYNELLEKEKLADKYLSDRRKGANKINAISKEEMRLRNKKAAEARWRKARVAVAD